MKQETDAKRTEELNLPELFVLAGQGDSDHFFCVPGRTVPRCPACGGIRIRNQGNMRRNLLDIIPRGDDAAVITLTLEFRKSKCLTPGCGCVFRPSFSFTGRYSRTTRRLEDVIVRMILEDGLSYSLISEALGGMLCKQAIGEIYYRRMNELESAPEEQPEWFKQCMMDDPNRLWRLSPYSPLLRQNSYCFW